MKKANLTTMQKIHIALPIIGCKAKRNFMKTSLIIYSKF